MPHSWPPWAGRKSGEFKKIALRPASHRDHRNESVHKRSAHPHAPFQDVAACASRWSSRRCLGLARTGPGSGSAYCRPVPHAGRSGKSLTGSVNCPLLTPPTPQPGRSRLRQQVVWKVHRSSANEGGRCVQVRSLEANAHTPLGRCKRADGITRRVMNTVHPGGSAEGSRCWSEAWRARTPG